jgi:hypothetical protein
MTTMRRLAVTLSALAGVFGVLWLALPLGRGWGLYFGERNFLVDVVVLFGFTSVAIGSVVWLLLSLILGWRSDRRLRMTPLLIVGLVFLIERSVDLELLATKWNFTHRMSQRLEVIRLVEGGQLGRQEPAPATNTGSRPADAVSIRFGRRHGSDRASS